MRNEAQYLDAVVRIELPDGSHVIDPNAPESLRAFPEDVTAPIYVVTADNPDGISRSAAENQQRFLQLGEELARREIEHWRADGGDREWRHVERGYALVNVSRAAAVEIGRKFSQEAIFEWSPGTLKLVPTPR